MIRIVVALLMLFLSALPVLAQEPELRIDMDGTEAIPGQPVSMRLTILVPTFMPAPPVWPSFEAPNLIVRVVSSGPVSERINGTTWSGVSRRYLLYPMLPGPVSLPSQEITVSWSDPGTNGTASSTLVTGPVTVTGIVPAGAEGLDPFLAANTLTLAQTIEGVAEGMRPGDSLTRTVTATIEGTLPMFLPQLFPEHRIDGLRAYPDAPVFEDLTSRDVAGGTRTERVTLVAEGGGAGEAGAVRLDWYNLRTGAIETAELPPIAVSVDGPPARAPGDRIEDWRAAIRTGLIAIAAFGLLLVASRRLLPPFLSWLDRRHAAWMASEVRAWLILRRTIAARDFAAIHAALDTWALRVPGPDPRRDPDVSEARASLGFAKYARDGADDAAGWRKLERTLAALRRRATAKAGPSVLPPLNPGT